MHRWSVIVIDGSEQGLATPLNDEIIIGRSLDNALVLSHSAVSRKHARIYHVNSVLYIEDLESTHGTKVNGETCTKRALSNRDTVTIGPVSMKIVSESGASTAEDANVLCVQRTSAPSASGSAALSHKKTLTGGDIAARFEAVLQIGLTLQGEREIGSLLSRIGNTLVDTLEIERCGIFLGDDNEPQIVSSAKGVENTQQLPFSTSLLARAVKNGEALVTADAGKNKRIKPSDSVVKGAIRSAMVAPMWGRENVVGAIVVESRGKTCVFDSEDLRLLVALANMAGTAVENTMLLQDVRREVEERAALSRFFSPAVAEHIRASGTSTALTNERKEITVLFTDIRGFTRLAETLAPEQLIKLLNEYFSELTDAVFAVEGCIDKFTGDGILALFGTPVPQEDHARLAVRAGQDILRRCEGIMTPGGEPLRIGIGIATGPAIVGPVGSEKRREYTAVGDVVNIAARLVEIAAAGQMLMAEATVAAAGLKELASHLGQRQVKGIERELSVYKVDAGALLTD